MRPSRQSHPGGGGGGGGGGGSAASGGSHYSPQTYYGQQRQFGFQGNGNYSGMGGGGGGGFGMGTGWGKPAYHGHNGYGGGPVNMPPNQRYASQQGGMFSGPGHGFGGPYQQFSGPNGSNGGSSRYTDNGWSNGRHDGFSGPSANRPSNDSRDMRRRSPSPKLSDEESNIRELVRALDRDVIERNKKLSLIWSKAHSDAFHNLLKATEKAEEVGSKRRALEPLLEAFELMIECRNEGRWDPSQKSRIGELREDLVNNVYDLCEDGNDKVRKLGYSAMRDLSKSDGALLKRNADVLVQLLQNEEPTEHDLIAKSLVGHLGQSPIEAFDVIIQDHCKGELRHLALSFLASPQAEKVLNKEVVGNAPFEAAFALRLADIIPLANDEEMELIKILLRPLSTLWLPSFDFATTEEFENASKSAVRLLAKLTESFVARFGAGSGERTAGSRQEQRKAIEDALSGSELEAALTDGGEMKEAQQLFRDLLDVSTDELDRSSPSDGRASSDARARYVKEVERALAFVHTFLPDAIGNEALAATTTLKHLDPPLQILTIRFAAETAAKLAEADAKAPPSPAFQSAESKKVLARAAVAAIQAFFPEGGLPSVERTIATQIFEILLAEALLMVLVGVDPPVRTGRAAPANPEIEEQSFRNRLRYLYGASQHITSSIKEEGNAKEAGRIVFDIVREYLKPRHNRANVHVKPLWWTPAPAFPAEEARKRDREEAEPGTSDSTNSKRSRQSDAANVQPSAQRPAPRGRGSTRAPVGASDSIWDDDDLFSTSHTIKGSAHKNDQASEGGELQKGTEGRGLSIKGAAAGAGAREGRAGAEGSRGVSEVRILGAAAAKERDRTSMAERAPSGAKKAAAPPTGSRGRRR